MSLTIPSRLLKQTVTIAPPTSTVGKHGEDNHSAGVDYPTRLERTRKNILNAQGELEPIHAIFYVKPGAIVAIGSKATYDGQHYRVKEAEDVPNRRGGIHHIEVMAQLWSFGT